MSLLEGEGLAGTGKSYTASFISATENKVMEAVKRFNHLLHSHEWTTIVYTHARYNKLCKLWSFN